MILFTFQYGFYSIQLKYNMIGCFCLFLIFLIKQNEPKKFSFADFSTHMNQNPIISNLVIFSVLQPDPLKPSYN